MGVAVIGDLIFIIGGWNGRSVVVEEVEVMNTTTQTMETLTRNPTGRRGMGVGVDDDRFIWTFGGFDGEEVVNVIEMCDIKTGEWKTLDVKMTSPRVYPRAVVVNDKIWIIGGVSSPNEPVIIDTKTMTWTTALSLIIPLKKPHCHWVLKEKRENIWKMK